MSVFGDLLRQYRKRCTDPLRGKRLTQVRLAELLGGEAGTGSYTGAAISHWEQGRYRIDQDNRGELVGLIKVFHRCGGIRTSAEANALLLAGNYRPLDETELHRISSEWIVPVPPAPIAAAPPTSQPVFSSTSATAGSPSTHTATPPPGWPAADAAPKKESARTPRARYPERIIFTAAFRQAIQSQRFRGWLKRISLIAVSMALVVFVLLVLVRPALAIRLNNSGLDYYRASQPAQAQALYQWAIAFDASYAPAHYNLALVYEDVQDFDHARAEYQIAVTGGLDVAYNNLARLYIRNGEYADAVELLNDGLELVSNDEVRYAMLKNLGWARLKQNRHAEAEAALRYAIDLAPDQAPAHCLLAQVLDSPTPAEAAWPEWEACLRLASTHNPDEDAWIDQARQHLADKGGSP